MYIYFIISTVINKMLMAPSVRLTVEMEQKEGDFRFKHMELRSHVESFALSGSVNTELGNVNKKLEEVCTVQQLLYNWNLPIDLSVNLFNYLGAILSYIVIAVPIFGGVYDSLDSGELAQVISETGFVCMYLVFQLSQLVNITSTVAGLAGSTQRVTELIERLQVIKTKEDEGPGGGQQCNTEGGDPGECVLKRQPPTAASRDTTNSQRNLPKFSSVKQG